MKITRRRTALINFRNGLLFVSPWIIGFVLFTLYPILSSLYYSFTEYNIMRAPVWVGLANFAELFTHDELFWTSLYNTVYYTVFSVPLGLIASVAIALLLNMKVGGMAFYRTVYYLPSIVPAVAVAVLWRWLLNPQYGLINGLLMKLHLPPIGWIADPKWAKPALILMGLWTIGGSIVIYLAGLQDIPNHLYEAAEIDGATSWHKTIHITLPLLSPTIFFNLVMGLIWSFQYFTEAFVMTRGGPANSTLFYSLYLYNNAFVYFKMGYASAMAWLLFLLVLLVTALTFRSSVKWVHYQR
ncbi:MAG: sugar ABC transporter permease [Firmicutes bacterium]|nr:sugar ABC transporter permease [Bacillota bacterium]